MTDECRRALQPRQAHVASLRWQGRAADNTLTPRPRSPLEGTPLPITPAVSTIQAAQSVPRMRTLQPGADLNKPPQHFLFGGGDGGGGQSSSPLGASPVLRERDWGERDLFSSLRTSIEFETSGLAGLGGDAAVDIIAPAERLKMLFTLPYHSGRVAFPVHRVGVTRLGPLHSPIRTALTPA